MKATVVLLILASVVGGMADVPRKAPLTKYKKLVEESPFTSKPPPAEVVQEGNPFEDYALCGVSPIAGGYRVTLINKKKTDEQLVVESNVSTGPKGFKILEVKRKEGNPLGTEVKLGSGNQIGTVVFDEKYLALAAAPVNKQAVPGNRPPTAQPVPQPMPQPGGASGNRPRVIPPPSLGNSAASATSGSSTSGVPGHGHARH